MKKYYFLGALTIPLITFIAVKLTSREELPMDRTLRIAVNLKVPANSYDPAHIRWVIQAQAIHSMYSTLVQYNDRGIIEDFLAESFKVRGDIVEFRLREDIKTVDGTPVTAEDAVLSFKRLMLKKTNTHGDLKTFLAIENEISSVSEKCTCLEAFDRNGIRFKLRHPELLKFLLPLLASPDYSVIPKNSVDWSHPDLPIIDQRNTSGVYYLEKDSFPHSQHFKLNPNHFYSKPNIPSELIFKALDLSPASIRKAIDSKDIDLFPTIFPLPETVTQELIDHPDFEKHSTVPIYATFIRFTQKGLSNYSTQERFAIADQLRTYFINEYMTSSKLMRPKKEFFGLVAEESLQPEEAQEIEATWLNASKVTLSKLKKPKLAFAVGDPEKTNLFFKNHHEFVHAPLPESQDQDVIVSSGDSGFHDDASLLYYYHKAIGAFGMSDAEFDHFMSAFLVESDQQKRRSMFRTAHFRLLKSGVMFPVALSPFYAFSRKPWKVRGWRLFVGLPFWWTTHQNLPAE